MNNETESEHYLKEKIAILEARLKLADQINNSGIDSVLVLDTTLRIVEWNKTCEILSGIAKKDAVGRDFFEIFPELRNSEVFSKAIRQVLNGFKVFVPSGNGRCVVEYSETHLVPIKENNETVTGILIIVHDVAYRIKAENELKALNRSLARMNKELKKKNHELLSFSHITSHDLKEPLRKIYTFSEMILNREGSNFTEQGRGFFKRIQAAVQRMNLLTDDILAYSQLNSDEKLMVSVDLNQTLEAAKYALIENSGQEFRVHSGQLPEMEGYPTLLVKLFQNILGNAIKFQKEGNLPVINVECIRISGAEIKHPDVIRDADYICISFKDNGIGFEKKYSERIFQMFQRLHSHDAYRGTGIGLAICEKIAEMHNGFIKAESEPGAGSLFQCFFLIRDKE